MLRSCHASLCRPRGAGPVVSEPNRACSQRTRRHCRCGAAPTKALAAIVGAQLLVIDLQAAGFDTIALIRAAHDRGAKVLAFGRHTDAATLRNAREAGADMAVARSQIAEDLRELIDQLLVGTSGRAPSQQ